MTSDAANSERSEAVAQAHGNRTPGRGPMTSDAASSERSEQWRKRMGIEPTPDDATAAGQRF